MTTLQTNLATDTWVKATWDEYIRAIENPLYEKAKSYYYNGQLRIEMSPIGNDHASDHSIIIYAVHLYAATKNIDLNGKDNCSYRKTGLDEAQPDASFYIGETADTIPWGTSIINLNNYPPPTLVIEVANTSLSDDKGEKRLRNDINSTPPEPQNPPNNKALSIRCSTFLIALLSVPPLA